MRYSGALGLGYRHQEFDDRSATTQFLRDLNLTLGGSIWQPWFATYSLSSLFSWVDTQTNTGEDLDYRLEVGKAEVQVFPVSRFPFRAFWEREDSRTENLAIATKTQDDRVTERTGFQQLYRPRIGDYSLSVDYTSTTTDELDAGLGRSESDLWTFRGQASMGPEHRFSGRLDLDAQSATLPDFDREIFNFNGDHAYTASRNLRLENRVLATEIRDQAPTINIDIDQRIAQLSNEIYWNSEDQRTNWRSDVRLESQEFDDRTLGDQRSRRILEIRQSVNRRVTDLVRASGTLRLARQETDATDSTDSSLSTTVSYSPETIALDRASYNWSTSASASHAETSNNDPRTTVSSSIGHGLSWVQPLDWSWFQILTLGGSQSLTLVHESENGGFGSTTASLTANLAGSQLNQNTVANATLTDTREFGNDADDKVNLLAIDVTHALSHGQYESWNVSYAATLLQQTLRGLSTDSENSYASLTYSNQRVWEVRGLTFLSELETNAASVNPFGETETGTIDRFWRNTLEYRRILGLLEFRSSVSAIITDTEEKYVFFVQARRNFGGAF